MRDHPVAIGATLMLLGLLAVTFMALSWNVGILKSSDGELFVFRSANGHMVSSRCAAHAEPAEDVRCPAARREYRTFVRRAVVLLPLGGVLLLVGAIVAIRGTRRARRDRRLAARRATVVPGVTPWNPDAEAWDAFARRTRTMKKRQHPR